MDGLSRCLSGGANLEAHSKQPDDQLSFAGQDGRTLNPRLLLEIAVFRQVPIANQEEHDATSQAEQEQQASKIELEGE